MKDSKRGVPAPILKDHPELLRLHHAMLQSISEERTAAKRALRLSEARFDVLARLSRMDRASHEQLCDFALYQSVRLTQSQYGYLAFLDENETTLDVYAWSSNARRICKLPHSTTCFRVDQTGLWGEVVRQRKPVVTNDYSAPNPLKRGLPRGHVPIQRYLGVPIFDGRRIAAVVGVANKKTPYDASDIRQLTLLVDGLWRILKHRRDSERIRENEERLKKVTVQMPGVMWMTDRDFRMVSVYGRGMEPLRGLTVTEVLKNAIPGDVAIEAHHQALAGKPTPYELFIFGRYFEAQVDPLRDHRGKIIGVIGLAFDISLRKDMEEMRRQHAKWILEAQERERRRIAKDLHDSVIQGIGSVRISLEMITSKMDGCCCPERRNVVARCSGVLKEINDEIRRISYNLRPPVLDEFGLAAAVRSLCDDLRQRGTMKVSLRMTGMSGRLPSETELSIYRMIQEAVANAEKHSGATRLSIAVSRRKDRLQVDVRDNGRGMKPSGAGRKRSHQVPKLGLMNLKERAAHIGGDLKVHSQSGRGVHVSLVLPLKEERS